MSRIRLGHIALSFHEASAAVVQILLERAGYEVELSAAPHAQMFERFGSGEVDGVVSAWLPASHGLYLDPLADRVSKLGVLYEPYCIWGVPDYVPQDTVASVGDLLKPEVAQRMTKLIQGIGPGAGISRFSAAMVEEYGLGSLGYRFQPGSEADCFGRFLEAVERAEWMVVPLWHPQWLHHRHRIRALSEPKGLLGGVDQATLVMSRKVTETMEPALVERLRDLRIGNAAVTALDHAICREGLSPREAAERLLRTETIAG